MKKLLTILAVAGVMAACNSGDDASNADTTATNVDTTTPSTPTDTSMSFTDTTGGTGADTTSVK